jgi:glyoxylase-like metal-dependent hydrolase (beta-lactamase superfamily II)/8-oxo-dGTP pyrophosphatase MutT (NUDIX family)
MAEVRAPRDAAAVVLYRSQPELRVLWMRRPDAASVLGGFQAFPGGVAERIDARLESGGGEAGALGVTALRELFEEVGVLVAHGAERLDDGARAELRAAFRRDAGEGAARLTGLGLSFATERLVPCGRWVTPDLGFPRFDTRFFALEVDAEPSLDPAPEEVASAEWVAPDAALARWGRGEALLPPPVASILRVVSRRGRFDAAAMRAERGADGSEVWTYEVVPGVQMLPVRTPTLPPATHTNAYLVGDARAVLIEPASPYPEEIDRVVAWVEENARAGVTVEAILATHHHPDHVGGAVALSERLGLPLAAHELTAERLDGMVSFARTIEDGERIDLDTLALRAVHTPGHAPGHLCFVDERSGAMIAGDMVAGIGTILIEPTDGDMALYLDSLRRMAALAPSLLLPAHGGPIVDVQGKLEHYVAHRLWREQKILAALSDAGTAVSLADLVPAAYDDAPPAVWPIARFAAEAHLVKLEREGQVRREGRFYRLP